MSKLLIVESPTKARTIGKMLGAGYDIIASMGHIRDLPEHELGIDLEHDFAPRYVDTPRSRPVVKKLREAAAKADEIYLAPDPDREGEAIAWHIKNVLEPKTKAPFYRVTFHEITRSAIEEALKHKGEIDLNRVDAQQARRVLDRIVGYKVSPLLWSQLKKGSSAGRVQSAALRLVVEREREILGFTPEEYWNFAVIFAASGKGNFSTRLFKINAKDFRIGSEADAMHLKSMVEHGAAPQVAQVTTQLRKRHPAPPFTTSTLQQSANTVLHYSATNTMRYAQQLYEGVELGQSGAIGLITYMRTDSVTIAREAQVACADFIRQNYGEEYAPAKFNYYRNKAAAQEAHEAIRPTDVRRTPESVAPYLDKMQLKLYTLIWRRFVASQMTPAQQNLTTADVLVVGQDQQNYTFRATATVPVFAGFTKVYDDTAKTPEESRQAQVLGALRETEYVQIDQFDCEQKFTEPPPRFSEAALIKALEENGIGRPSTYATILRTIQDREYVKKDQGKLCPEELGFQVNDFLTGKLPELFNIGFTAQMEQELDDVEAGERSWVQMMTEFYAKFTPWIDAAKAGNAAPPEESQMLLNLLDGVEFDPARKIGSRNFNDKRFVTSVKKKFDQDAQISERQQQALLAVAAKYLTKIDAVKLQQLPENLKSQLQTLQNEQQQAAKAREAATQQAAESGILQLFDQFSQVEFSAPETRGRRTYDDSKFIASLRDQAQGGKALSEKQLQALGKLVAKYKEQLPAAEQALKTIGVAAPVTEPVNAEQQQQLKALLDGLEQVKTWADPVKKGRFTFDDKQFYQSLRKQFFEGRQLSPRQISALKKVADKYGVK